MGSVFAKKHNDASPLFLTLFGIPFALAGLGIFLWGLSMLNDYRRMGSWEKVPATFSKLQLHERRGSKGGRTWVVTGNYEYRWKGTPHRSSRIVIEDGSSSEYGFWKGLYDEIERTRKEGRTFNVLVNPAEPGDSIAIRRISMVMVILPPFGLVFLMVGLGVMFSGVRSHFQESRRNALASRFPGQPWRMDDFGIGFRISEGALGKTLALCGIAIGASLFISIFLYVVTTDPNAPLFAKLIIGLFVLVIAGLDYQAGYTLLRYLKYGDPTLMLSEWPVAIGKPFVGAVVVGRHVDQDAGGVKVTLKCLKKTTTGSGKQRKTHTDELFANSTIVKRDLGGGGRSAIPFTLDIPERDKWNSLPSRSPDTNPEIEWKLEVVAETPGIDFGAEFAVPVYAVDNPDLIQKRALA